MATVLLARQLFTPLEAIPDAALVMEDGLIAAVGTVAELHIPPHARVLDFGDAVLAPGLIDIHIHGGAGHDVMEGSDEGLASIERLDGEAWRHQLLSDNRDGSGRCNTAFAGRVGPGG